jgi:hypothetical protein
MTEVDEGERCDNCDHPHAPTKVYNTGPQPRGTRQEPMRLCIFCASTFASLPIEYPSIHLDDKNVMNVLGYGFNEVLHEVRCLRAELLAAREE